MRRSAVSVASNLAEGFGRRTKADKVRFYTMATGSLSELQSQMIIAKDLGYLPEETFQKNWSMSISAYRLTNGLIASADKALF
jgi:four helix bundle protein